MSIGGDGVLYFHYHKYNTENRQ